MTNQSSPVDGVCPEQFAPVRDAFTANLDSGEDLGASVAVTVDGQSVVDLWGGWSDTDRTAPWERDTITNVWSTTKTMTNLCALVLADRGALDLDAPVATYWPEFAANGKAGVLVRHLLSHTSGVSAWAQPVQLTDIYDWERSTAMLAAQAPWWEPGSASGYHALNQGHLVGEVVRRVSGKGLKQFFAEEVAGPLGADFQIGCAPADFGRVSNVVPPPALDDQIDFTQLDPESTIVKTFTGPLADAPTAWTPEWRAADIGAANGHGNARSVARVQSVVANGGTLDGVQLLSPRTISRIFEVQAEGPDLVLMLPLRFGIGYGLPNESLPYLPAGNLCYWGGWGGSVVLVDTDRHVVIAFMMNRMGAGIIGSERAERIVRATYASLG